jgi:hypothetical protein
MGPEIVKNFQILIFFKRIQIYFYNALEFFEQKQIWVPPSGTHRSGPD